MLPHKMYSFLEMHKLSYAQQKFFHKQIFFYRKQILFFHMKLYFSLKKMHFFCKISMALSFQNECKTLQSPMSIILLLQPLYTFIILTRPIATQNPIAAMHIIVMTNPPCHCSSPSTELEVSLSVLAINKLSFNEAYTCCSKRRLKSVQRSIIQ